jgi:predicted phage terminase large subunit-like protein
VSVVRIPLYITAALDPAVTSKSYSNASGFTINGCAKDGTWYTLCADAFKGQPDQVIDRAVYHALTYKPKVFSCEDIAAQRLFLPMLREAFEKYGIQCSVQAYKYSTRLSKHARISSLQPKLKQGKWFFRKGFCDELIRQMLQYPEGEDDLIDSMVQHIQFSRPYNEYGQDVEEDDFNLDDEEFEADPFRLNGSYVGRLATRYAL